MATQPVGYHSTTFTLNGAQFQVQGFQADFEGGPKQAVIEIDGGKSIRIRSAAFNCVALLNVTVPDPRIFRVGFVQVVQSLSRKAYYEEGSLSYEIAKLPLYDTTVNSEDAIFPFTKGSETAIVNKCTNKSVFLSSSDSPRIAFLLKLDSGFPVGQPGEKAQKLLRTAEKIEFVAWLVARDESTPKGTIRSFWSWHRSPGPRILR